MRYRVTWTTKAEAMLADLWLNSSDRNTVTAAVGELDVQLAIRPFDMGESRESTVRRVAWRPPIGIEFQIVEDDKKVIVQGVFAW